MINRDWSFEDTILHIEALKEQYYCFLTSFSYFERKKRIALCRNFKTQIYSLNFEEHKRNLIWRYINDEIEYEDLIGELNNANTNKRNDKII